MAKEKKDKTNSGGNEPVTMMEAPINLNYHYTAGRASTHFLTEIRKGRLIGLRCEDSEDVYVPPRGSCPKRGAPTTVEVPMSGKGSIESFTIVHIPIPGNPIKPPFVVANILLDGASLSFIHLVSEVNNEDVRIGMRVEPVWKPENEWTYSFENIRYFRPLDEPDTDIDALRKKHHA